MKTESIASVVAIFGATLTLNLSALAGPGPQPQFQTRKISEQKKVIVASSQARKSPATAKAVIKSEPTLHYVSGPKGLTFAFRK